MLNGKVAIVTGAGRGIGRQVAMTLAEYGAKVAVNYNLSEQKALEAAEKINSRGGTAAAYQCSVTDLNACRRMVDDVLAMFGHIDILVNNAGIIMDRRISAMDGHAFQSVIDTNLTGSFNMIKCIYQIFQNQQRGRIINISSVIGLRGNVGQANYSASKAGLVGLTKSAARELALSNVTVNAIAPGFIETDMTDSMSEKAKERALSQIPMGRMGKTGEVAEAAAFLASDKASYITGQVLVVDGGMT